MKESGFSMNNYFNDLIMEFAEEAIAEGISEKQLRDIIECGFQIKNINVKYEEEAETALERIE